MAALPNTHPSLLDLSRRSDPDGNITKVIEILEPTNEILPDMTWQEGNLVTGNRSVIRTGYPTPTWRKLYGGVQPTKGSVTQVTDNCGRLEAFAEIDKALADLNGNTADWRMAQEVEHLMGMNIEITRALLYASEATAPEQITGVMPRFNSTAAENGDNIILGGGTGTDNNSILLVYWGPSTIYGIIPKGTVAGLQRTYYGEQVMQDASDGSNTGRMVVYQTHFVWNVGLTVPDWRSVVRVPNIDKSLLTPDASTGANLPNLMFEALERVPAAVAARGRPVFYMSRQLLTALRQQMANGIKTSTLTYQELGGIKVPDFQGIPIRRVDGMSADEALVS